MQHLLNSMRAVAQQATQSRASTRHGLVTSYDPNTYAVKVTLQPDNVVTGWIPLKSPWIGNGWGLFCPPSIGDAVEVDFQEDDAGVGSVGMRFFNDADRPLPCPSGEFWLVHQSGSRLKFENDGSVELHAAADLRATVAGQAFLKAAGFISNESESVVDLNAPKVSVRNALAVGNGASGTVIDANGKVVTFQAGICTDIS